MPASFLKSCPPAAASLRGALSRGVALLKQRAAALARGDELALDATERRELARAMATVEAGYLAVAADGEVASVELDALLDNVAVVLGGALSRDELAQVVDELEAGLDADGLDARIDALGAALGPDDRRGAFALACVVSLCDGETADEELDVLGRLAEAFELPEDEANAVFNELADRIDESL